VSVRLTIKAKSTQAKYEMIPSGIASVSSDGLVTAAAVGSTKLVVHLHSSSQIVVAAQM
jgi:hypothetical protein